MPFDIASGNYVNLKLLGLKLYALVWFFEGTDIAVRFWLSKLHMVHPLWMTCCVPLILGLQDFLGFVDNEQNLFRCI